MRANRTLEIGTGFFVLLGFAALFFLTTQLPANGLKVGGGQGGYTVTAEFDNVGDLKVGAPVTMSGVDIGAETDIRIDPQDYRARVTMRIDPRYNMIPDDSDASINTQGLLGGQYVAIGAGSSETYLKNGSQIQFTQSALVLENLINKLFASFAGKGNESGGGGTSAGGGGSGATGSPSSLTGSESGAAASPGSGGASSSSATSGTGGGKSSGHRRGAPGPH